MAKGKPLCCPRCGKVIGALARANQPHAVVMTEGECPECKAEFKVTAEWWENATKAP